MNLLYLTEDYYLSKVHNNLIANMIMQNPALIVYVVTPTRPREGYNLSSSYVKDDRIIEVPVPIDIPIMLYRLDFWAKIRCKVRLIEQNVPMDKIDFIQAATLFTEGCTALKLHNKYGIPYNVSVRGSDSDFYAKYMCHLKRLGNKVLKHAHTINCLTPVIKSNITKKYSFISSLTNVSIINNGIDEIWLRNLNVKARSLNNPIRILYIGQFFSNKNVLRVIESVKRLKDDYNIHLTLIGGDGEEQKAIEDEVKENSTFIEYLGKIYDKTRLMEIVRKCDIFTMVSHSETFGLVYAECLSQGLPIVYSKNTGFDNMYPQGHVGYAVDSYSVDSIANGIKNTIEHYPELIKNISTLNFERFSWKDIASKHIANIQNCK